MNRLPSHSLVAQSVKNLVAMQGSGVRSLGQKALLERELQYSCLGNPTDRGAWRATVRGVTEELDTT